MENICQECLGTGFVEILGDGENFECDVIGTRPCTSCNEEVVFDVTPRMYA